LAGNVWLGNGVVITNDFTIPSSTSDLSMGASNGNIGTWAGNIVNLGGGASWRPGSDGGTLYFTGSAILGSRNFIVPRGTVHFASNALVSATGTATALGRDSGNNNRSATITLQNNATLTLGQCSMGGGKGGGSITLTIEDSAILSIGANSFDLHDTTTATAVNTLNLNGGVFAVGGFVKSKTNAVTFNFNGGVLEAGAGNASFLPVLSALTAAVGSGGAIINDGGFAVTLSQPLLHLASLGAALDGGLVKQGAGILTLAGAETYTGPTVINAGTLALSGSGTIANSVNILIDSGALLDAGAIGGFSLGSGRSLSGNGSVNGNFTAGAGATLKPGSGNAIGALAFSNSLTLAAGCTNVFKISHSPLTNDFVSVGGLLANGGTLIVTNVGPGAPAAADSFRLFSAAGCSGAFAALQLPPLAGALAWNTNALNTSGLISVVSIAPPASPGFGPVLWSGGNVIFTGTNGAAGSCFFLLGSTNLNLPLTNWMRLLTNQFDSQGNFNFTNPINPEWPQTFYILELQ
jgi:autotransporter-associated beta strand protein